MPVPGSLVTVDVFLSVTKIFTITERTIQMMCGLGGCGCRYSWYLVSIFLVLFQVYVAGKFPSHMYQCATYGYLLNLTS